MLKADQGAGDGDIVALHVLGSATVPPTVLFSQLEGGNGPVFRLGLHHVQMPDPEDGFEPLGLAAQTDHQLGLVRMFRDHDQSEVSFSKACSQKVRLERLRSPECALVVDGVDADEFAEQVVGESLVGGRRHGCNSSGNAKRSGRHEGGDSHRGPKSHWGRPLYN